MTDILRESLVAYEGRITAFFNNNRATKKASAMTDTDFQSLNVMRFILNDAFWSMVKFRVSDELHNLSMPVVERITAEALDLLSCSKHAEVEHVQPLARSMIEELLGLVNDHFEVTFSMDCEQSFTTVLPIGGQPLKVVGKYDAVIRGDTGVPVMSWEFKDLKGDLANKHIAQLVATIWHGIKVTQGMHGLPHQAVGFVTSMREWIMVTATLQNGDYKWKATPVLSTMCGVGDAVVDVAVCGHVATLLSYAFSNAKSLHDVAAAALLRDFDFPGPSGLGDEGGYPRSDDDPTNDRNDEGDETDHASRNHGEGGTDTAGHSFQSKTGRRPLGNVDSNCTAPLTTWNVEKYESMTWPQRPLDRIESAPYF